MRVYRYIVLLFCVLAFSCSTSDELGQDWYGIRSENVPAQIGNALHGHFPDAESIEWEVRDRYYTALFRSGGFETEAWFTVEQGLVLTVTELPPKSERIPDDIRHRLQQDKGKDIATAEEVKRVERPYFAISYHIEFAQKEFEYTEKGVLIKESDDLPDPYPILLPEALVMTLHERYPDAEILQAETEGDVWHLHLRTPDSNMVIVSIDSHGKILSEGKAK